MGARINHFWSHFHHFRSIHNFFQMVTSIHVGCRKCPKNVAFLPLFVPKWLHKIWKWLDSWSRSYSTHGYSEQRWLAVNWWSQKHKRDINIVAARCTTTLPLNKYTAYYLPVQGFGCHMDIEIMSRLSVTPCGGTNHQLFYIDQDWSRP